MIDLVQIDMPNIQRILVLVEAIPE